MPGVLATHQCIEEALHDAPGYREFAGLRDGASRLLDETTILWFRDLREAHDLAADMLRAVALARRNGSPAPQGRAGVYPDIH